MDITDGSILQQSNTLYVGTFSSTDNSSTTNGTEQCGSPLVFRPRMVSIASCLQANDGRTSIWSHSYDGHYGTSFTAYFQQQNERIVNKTIAIEGEMYSIHRDTVGVIIGCIDLLTKQLSYPQMAFNITHGFQVINATVYQQAVDSSKQDMS